MKTTEEMIEVMQAFVDGKEIECMGGKRWLPASSPNWGWGSVDYRIKPEVPKFKLGDYFVHNGKPHRVHKVFGDSYQAEDGLDYRDNIKPWTIEDAADDNWVLVWKYGLENLRYLRTKVNYLVHVDIYGPYDNVIPYIGQTPDELI